MREIEFLPDWYPVIRRRKRVVTLQGWLMLVIALSMALWVFLVHRNIRMAEASDGMLREQLHQTHVELTEMDQLDQDRKALRHQEEILNSLGLHVESYRIIRALDEAMPTHMSLLGMQFDVEDLTPPAGARLAPAPARHDRRLNVRIQCVAPTDVELTDFMTRLSAKPFFEQIAVTYAKECTQNGRVMREFEVTFRVNLDSPAL
jgi:Tfp pilus assembly protein PilN